MSEREAPTLPAGGEAAGGVARTPVPSSPRPRSGQRMDRAVLRKELWNLPNMLTMGRIGLIPLFAWFAGSPRPASCLLAALVFTVAALTDVIDGYLARRWNMITVTGKLLDPLADKLIVAAALVMMVRLGRVEAWLVIVLLSREFIVTGLRQIAASEGMVIAAGQEGKWKTSLQLVGIVSLLVHYPYDVFLGVGVWTVSFHNVGTVLMYLSTGFSVWSAVAYFRAFLAMLAERPAGGHSGPRPSAPGPGAPVVTG